MVYERFVKQLDGCQYCSGGLNCTCAVEAMWLWRASQGKISISACQVRMRTGDRSGGTHLGQMEQVSHQFGITGGKVYRPMSFAAFVNLINTGRYGAHLNMSYRSFAGTRYDCFGGKFRGNHDLFASNKGATSGTLRIGDPGADGRRSGIPKGFQDIPVTLLRKAAGQLDLGGRQLGDGLVYAYLTPADPVAAAPHYSAVTIRPTSFWNEGSQRWVYVGVNARPAGTKLEVRGVTYTKGGVPCYPVTCGEYACEYSGYYVPKANVKLGGPV